LGDGFRVQGCCPKKEIWVFLMKNISEISEKNRNGTYNLLTMGHCFQGSYQGRMHIPQKGNLTYFDQKVEKIKIRMIIPVRIHAMGCGRVVT